MESQKQNIQCVKKNVTMDSRFRYFRREHMGVSATRHGFDVKDVSVLLQKIYLGGV